MFLNDHPPIAAGREIWGFPKKLAQPTLAVETDTLVGTLNYGSVRIATGTMGYKHRALDCGRSQGAGRAEFPAEGHSACGWQPAHLRARPLLPRRREVKGAWRDLRPWRSPARLGADCRAARARGALRQASRRRSDARSGHRRPRLPRLIATQGRRKMHGESNETAQSARNRLRSRTYDVIALVLQGGGALGAYQAGIYEGLHEAGIRPTWLAGISIGALNAAIIAGPPESQRVARLREFWETICAVARRMARRRRPGRVLPFAFDLRSATMPPQQCAHSLRSARLLQAPLSPTLPVAVLRRRRHQLLRHDATARHPERLVDFDLLNSGDVRVSVAAVNVRSGNLVYFDTAERRLRPEHFMASGALPPGFPAVGSTASITGMAASSRTRRSRGSCRASRGATR